MTCLGIIQTESYEEELYASARRRHLYLVCVIYLTPRILRTGSLVNSEAEYHCLTHAVAPMSLCCLVSHASRMFPQLAREQCQEIAKWALPALTCSWLLERTKITDLIWKENQAGAWLLQTLLGHLWAWVQAPTACLGSAGRCSGNPCVPGCCGRPCCVQDLCRKDAAVLFKLSTSFIWSRLLVPSG